MNEAQRFKSAVGTLQSAKATAAQKAAALRTITDTHAKYGVPYMGKPVHPGLWTYSGPHAKPKAPAKGKSISTVPAARGTTVASTAVRLGGVGGKIRVNHRELCHSIKPSGATFELTSFEVNPGLNEIFPWLSGLAHSFDQYAIVNWAIEYVPSCSTSEAGAVYMSWDPDPTDDAPESKSQMANSSYSIAANAWKSFTFRLPSCGVKFTRSGSTAQSLTLYDHGQLHIATEGTGTNQLGDVYVSYTIELIRPHVFSSGVSDFWVQHLRTSGGTISENELLGDLPFTYRGRRIFDPAKSEYSANTCRLYLSDCPSYEDGGVRKWAIDVQLYQVGTGLAVSFSSTNASVTYGSEDAVINGASTAKFIRKTFIWTTDPTGSYVVVDTSASTTQTDINIKVHAYSGSTYMASA